MDEAIEPSLQLTLEEMVVPGHDHREPRWSKTRINDARPFSVGIIGAGESGLLTATRLRQAGIPFCIYEKNSDVGGTWLENHYPGYREAVCAQRFQDWKLRRSCRSNSGQLRVQKSDFASALVPMPGNPNADAAKSVEYAMPNGCSNGRISAVKNCSKNERRVKC
jgi:hypothetical protein